MLRLARSGDWSKETVILYHTVNHATGEQDLILVLYISIFESLLLLYLLYSFEIAIPFLLLVLSDGSRLPADVVVLAYVWLTLSSVSFPPHVFVRTGNSPMITNATSLFGPRITDKIGNKIWGLDSEGELNNCFRPTGQRGLWIVTGGFQQSRFLSKHLVSAYLFYGTAR